jgi:response regulator RpfG family c-di-GMP phosphodiesterase
MMFTNTILPHSWLGAFRIYSRCFGWRLFRAAICEIILSYEKCNNRKTVLCIDDQPLPLLIRKILLVHAGYAVLTAEAPLAGLHLFTSEQVHAVVLHHCRGEMDSGVVAARMKHLKPDTPIILLCGSAEEPVGAVPMVDVLMRKLESPNILLAKLSEVLYGNHSSLTKKKPKGKTPEAKWIA